MGKEHVKDAQLNDSLICTRPETVQDHGSEPLSCAVELSEPHTSAEAEDGCDQENGSAPYLHCGWDPEYVHKTLNSCQPISLSFGGCDLREGVESTTTIHVGETNAGILTDSRPCSS